MVRVASQLAAARLCGAMSRLMTCVRLAQRTFAAGEVSVRSLRPEHLGSLQQPARRLRLEVTTPEAELLVLFVLHFDKVQRCDVLVF